MIIKRESVGGRTVSITYPAVNGLYCIETTEYAPDWCYPWEIREDGTRACAYSFASNRKQALSIYEEMLVREKMNARRTEQ